MRRLSVAVLALMVALYTTPQMAFAGVAAQGTGTITGVAKTSGGQALAGQTVQIRNVKTNRVVGSTTTDAAGGYSFAGLAPGDYVIELVDPSRKIIGASAITAVASGVNALADVILASTALVGGAIGTPLVILLLAAGAAGATGIYFATKDEASPSK